jgi:hypothetical protein
MQRGLLHIAVYRGHENVAEMLAIGHRGPLGILLLLQLKGNIMTSSAGDKALGQRRNTNKDI